MTKKTRSELQNIFRQGATPSGEDFKDLIQSTLNVTDVGIDKPVEDEPLKIIANGIEEKLLDFYAGDTKTWSIDQKPNENNPGLNISTESQSKLFIAKDTGNVGISTDSPGAKLEISGDLKLRFGVAVNKFSTDGTLADNSDLVIPTEKAIKTYADTKASLAGSSSQDFTANNLTVNGTTGLSVNGNAKIEFSQSMRQMINLWGAGNPYGIGIQDYTIYFRTGRNFAWYQNGSHDSNELNPGTGGTVQMVIKDSNVGIGTDNPSEKLEVNGNIKSSGLNVSGDSNLATLTVTGDTNLNTLNVDNPIFQKLDIIACENNSNWSSSTHPIKVYFHNKLQGKQPGTMIYVLTDHPSWQGFIWRGWVDATEGTSLIRVAHSYANTKATTTNNSGLT